MLSRNQLRIRVHRRLRRRLQGSGARPRVNVYRSLQHIYLQAIDDLSGTTLAAFSTNEKAWRDAHGGARCTVAAAKEVGAEMARRLKQRGIESIVLDRGGYRYHGVIKAVADSLRAAGLRF
ncbi:MAG TPA: 50S ribosomal protein L18 [Acidobacteriota bacterium]|jgi:large subunit ribosomal protein L18